MFDIKKLELNRTKAKDFIQTSPFHQFIQTDILDRLEPIEKNFKEILIINPIIEEMLILHLRKLSPEHNLTISGADQNIDYPADKFDLIIFPFGLHWVNNLQAFLVKIHQILHRNGIFICNFPGGGSLMQLRRTLVEVESAYSISHAPHISPFIQFEQVSPLLQHAGFAENIIDMESVELEYESPLSLMLALKNAAESNVLTDGVSYSITKKMYQALKQTTHNLFTDRINLITFLSSPSKNSIKLKSGYYETASR